LLANRIGGLVIWWK